MRKETFPWLDCYLAQKGSSCSGASSSTRWQAVIWEALKDRRVHFLSPFFFFSLWLGLSG